MPFGVKPVRAQMPATATTPGIPPLDIDFDLVYEHLIAPAVARAGAVPMRADQETAAGDIRTDMFYELVTADIVVADISVLNANVFYELGVRHGVAPRGVFMVHGGWSKRPFDVVTDRTFDYEGRLFDRDPAEPEASWKARVAAEAEQLGDALRAAIETDVSTVSSPVYKELPGLKPVDWSSIQTARAKYFGDVFADWKARVEIARLNGWPGDILTLADEAPTNYHAARLLWAAADALCSMERFAPARQVLRELLSLDPNHREAQTRMGLVLAELGEIHEAKLHMGQLVERHMHDPEAHGILGRVYKDLWRLEWRTAPDAAQRQLRAIQSSRLLVTAIGSYDRAARRHFDFYTGVNVVSLVKVLEHLASVTGIAPAAGAPADVADLIAVSRFGARAVLARAGLEKSEGVWAAATLGEIELVAGDGAAAENHYRDAAFAPATTLFHLGSMLDQILLLDHLGFRPDAVARVRQLLEERQSWIAERTGAIARRRFNKVCIASGHMIDAAQRATPRFPPAKEDAVRAAIAEQLGVWKIGPGDLAICGAARGADILFAELCAERGAEVWLLVALDEPDFLERSVRLQGSNWESRYYALQDLHNVKTCVQTDRLKSPPRDVSPFTRNNLWILNTARVEVSKPSSLYALLVWDEQPSGDGPGGTADFANRVRQIGGRRAIVNPTQV